MVLSKNVCNLVFFLGCCLSFHANAAVDYWQDIESSAFRHDAPLMIKAREGRLLLSDIESLSNQLSSDGVDIELPLPNGETAVYHLEYSPIAEQGLLDKFPDIRTFRGVDVDNSNNRGRFDISPSGFRGMFRHNGETIFIDPQYRDQSNTYISYYSHNAEPLEQRLADRVLYTDLLKSVETSANRTLAKGSSDGNLRTYRLAVAATGEYTAFFGGTVSAALSAITTAINRVNEVYENDLGIRLVLVANNNDIIYTNASADPYANDGFGDLNVNQNNINAVIGTANYDIGHLFGIGTGGVAQLGSVCSSSGKARGLTGLNNPTGDTFYIDFVSHEIGHQFGANHTFNGTTSSCGGANRNQGTAYEPGSGSTIMAYAGICGSENLQNSSDPYFHAGSIAEITNFVTSGGGASCGSISTPANTTPNASAGPDVTIPANTPFVLTGSATDADVGDTLNYVWEQLDAGTASSSQAEWVDNGSRTIFRSLSPTTNPVRYLPNLPDVLDGSITAGEAFPTTNRDLNFRFTVRDGSGETAFENKVVSVTTGAGPFAVLTPGVGSVWSQGTALVTWNVANTDSTPVNCSQVDITYSSDGGSTFGITLASNVANDGSQSITVPTNATTQGRVMVSCIDNIFYAVSDSDFEVSASTVAPTIISIDDVNANEGSTITFTSTLNVAPTSNTNFSFSLNNGTTDNSDYGLVNFDNGVTNNNDGTITVPSGVSNFSVAVVTVDDTLVEASETFTLNIGGVSGTGTILDNDSVSTSPTIVSVSNANANEGGNVVATVTLSATTTVAENYTYSINNVTTSNSDYGLASFGNGVTNNNNGTITVPVGVSSFTFSVGTIDDSVVEGDESFTLIVDGVTGTGTIQDNDRSSSSGGGGGGASGVLFLLMSLFLAVLRRRAGIN